MAQKVLRPAIRYLSCVRQSATSITFNQRCLSLYIQRKISHRSPLLSQSLSSTVYFKDLFDKKYSTQSREPPRPWTDVTITQLMSGIRSNIVQLFDVRTPKEVIETGMMPGATNIPLSEIAEAFELSPEAFKAKYGVEMPSKRDPNIVLHCLGGIRSSKAVVHLHTAGYFLARHYPGGWEEYESLRNHKDFESLRPWTDINYEKLMSMIKSKDIQLFDVRRAEEVEQTGMMPGATNIPLAEVEEALKLSASEFRDRYGVAMPSKDDGDVVIHCLAGFRSLGALSLFWEAGYHKVRQFPGGWVEYAALNES